MDSDPTTSLSEPPTTVIFDLDGVIRDWNDKEIASVELAHGLEPGAILAVGFCDELGPACMTGAMSYRDWMDEIRRRVIARHGEHTAGALDFWECNIGYVNPDMVDLLRAVREHAVVACLSNGTTRLRRDLHALDLTGEFDIIFNTAEIGTAKPDPAIFQHVLGELDVPPGSAAFVDDLLENVHGARSVGINAHQHVDRSGTRDFLIELGLPLTFA